jgi:hypothetical protein
MQRLSPSVKPESSPIRLAGAMEKRCRRSSSRSGVDRGVSEGD